jgi:hypothetical protein
MSLKTQNAVRLALLLIANLAVFAAATRGDSLLSGLSAKSMDDLRQLIPAGLAATVVGLLTSQIPSETKARLIFMRRRDPLPGCRAFTHYAQQDARIDTQRLTQIVVNLPSEPREQNATWYRLYRAVQEDPAVIDAHRQFLFARDYATMMVMLALALLPLAVFLSDGARPVLVLGALFLIQTAIAIRAARVNGERLVCNVLALTTATGGTRG